MATIEATLKVGPNRELRAVNTVEMDKIGKLKPGEEVLVKISNGETGKWGMARLWRGWMASTADYMASSGCVMPLMLKEDGSHYGQRKFNAQDAHELFTMRWLGSDKEGNRLSWSKNGTDDSRPATKGERFLAMQQHEQWATDKGIVLNKPKDSEYSQLERESNGQ